MGISLMEFYACSDIVEADFDLPITRYRGEITDINKLNDGAIAFTESLPLGNKQQRLISSDSIFLGTLEEAIKFYFSEVVVVATISAIQTLIFKNSAEVESMKMNINDLETSLANSEIAINSYCRQLEISTQKINDLETSLANSEIAINSYCRQLEISTQKINDLETSLANSEIAPIRYEPIEQSQPNTSLSILGRFD
jgi:chromosome segregation ATPase